MKPACIGALIVLSMVACSNDQAATASDTSSSGDTSSSAGPTTAVTLTDATSSDTTCVDGCATTTESSGESTGVVDGSSTDTGSGDTTTSESSGTTSESSSESSSEGPVAVCGDGTIEADEECDDGIQTATCDFDCTLPVCGDGHPNLLANEECDAGGESFACDSDCTMPACGDGLLNASANEICDDGGASATCDEDCTAAECGDGIQNTLAFETCDDGNISSDDGCSSSCVIEGDFGGVCRVVGDTQWCFDADACGQACEDVCGALGLTLAADDAEWSAAQDTPAECQAISDAFGLDDPIQFDVSALGCLEDGGVAGLTGGGLTGGLLCSSDPTCPSNHRTDMDDLGLICNLPGARRSVCPCEGPICGNGVVEGAEACDDGNKVNGDGCSNTCTLCGGLEFDPGNGIVGCWYTSETTGMSCTEVCEDHGGFDAVATQHTGNAIGFQFWPTKADGGDWETIECSSTDNDTNWGANGLAPDPFWTFDACYVNCACFG